MVKVENLIKQFNCKVLYNNLSFHIKKSENVCVKGDSGSGKSTLLKIIQGYQPISSGEIFVDGVELNSNNIVVIRKKIIWIPQKFIFSIQNGLELARLITVDAHIVMIKQFMDNLNLSPELLTQNFKELSEGQKQRLVMAICLSIDRPLLLMDEPTSALDEGVIDNLIGVVKKTGKTILSTSHNTTWLNNVDRIINI